MTGRSAIGRWRKRVRCSLPTRHFDSGGIFASGFAQVEVGPKVASQDAAGECKSPYVLGWDSLLRLKPSVNGRLGDAKQARCGGLTAYIIDSLRQGRDCYRVHFHWRRHHHDSIQYELLWANP